MVREHVAQLWSRRRNQKGMDYAKGRALIGKFELGQIVAMPVCKYSIARFAVFAARQIAGSAPCSTPDIGPPNRDTLMLATEGQLGEFLIGTSNQSEILREKVGFQFLSLRHALDITH